MANKGKQEPAVQPWATKLYLSLSTHGYILRASNHDEAEAIKIIAAHAPSQAEADRLVEVANQMYSYLATHHAERVTDVWLSRWREAIAAYEKARKGNHERR
jgi:hypothetical protein